MIIKSSVLENDFTHDNTTSVFGIYWMNTMNRYFSYLYSSVSLISCTKECESNQPLNICLINNTGLFGCGSDYKDKPVEGMDVKQSNMEDILVVGSQAPGFSLPDQHGRRINSGDYLGKLNLVVFFYPKDESYGCTIEACSFRDNYEVFRSAGAMVIGISSDDIPSHQAFAANHKLPFLLLSDRDKSVSDKYGVVKSLGALPGRVTYVVDKHGVIRMAFSSQLNFEQHVTEAMKMLKEM